jgi:HlyD family secretion protein
MKRVLIVLLVVVVSAGAAAYFGGFLDPYLPGAESSETAGMAADGEGTTAADGSTLPVISDNQAIIADARVVPANSADLSLPVSGIVAEVLVAEGDDVAKGDVLVRLDADAERAAVSRAEADLKKSLARLAELQAGARQEDIDAARASLEAAEAARDRVSQGSLPGDIAAAEAQVSAARAGVAKVYEGASEQELINAKADMANAQAELTRAQRAFNEVKWRNDAAATTQSSDLQTATNNYEAAAARYQDLQSDPSPADAASASAEVRRAQAQLDALGETLPADVAAADAEVRRVRAQLELLEAGSRPEEIESAEAEVAASVASLQQALVAVADRELRSPFDGSVALLDLETGEQVSSGTSVVRLADLLSWEVRTEDLTEFDIVGVEPGDAAALTFDAIPDLTLSGTVDRIRPIGEDRRGDIVYTVVVIPDENDDRLRWNMTAVTTFERD